LGNHRRSSGREESATHQTVASNGVFRHPTAEFRFNHQLVVVHNKRRIVAWLTHKLKLTCLRPNWKIVDEHRACDFPLIIFPVSIAVILLA
jgi:hypothetical protein